MPGFDGNVLEYWPSKQQRGRIRPAAFCSPYLRDDQRDGDRDLVDHCYRENCRRRSHGGAAALIDSAVASSAKCQTNAIEIGVFCQKRRNRTAKNGPLFPCCVPESFRPADAGHTSHSNSNYCLLKPVGRRSRLLLLAVSEHVHTGVYWHFPRRQRGRTVTGADTRSPYWQPCEVAMW